jgi:SAM-dependent methyltransferase
MNFDEAARTWDKEERRITRAKSVAERLRAGFAARPGLRALDFGCGTGLLSFFLRDAFSEIVLLDASGGMIEVLGEKIARDDEDRRGRGARPGAAMRPVRGTIDAEVSRLGSFDLAYTMLVLHHIPDTLPALRGLASALAPGGTLFVVELDKEDGSFHKNEAGFEGHDGFDRGELAALAVRAGFMSPSFEDVWIERRSAREYPMFLMRAEKE